MVQEFLKSRQGLVDSAKKGKTLSEEAVLSAQKSMEVVNIISQITEKAKSSLNYLEDASKKISEVIDTIKDIADQTSLLALNAAIEAARAGEGSNVIMSGIESLKKLSSVTIEISDAVFGRGAMAQAIMEMIKKIKESIEEVASAAEENASATEEITSSIEEVSSSLESQKEIINELTK
ncbi:MAG: methyl-accepting chemotaxis protein [Candidatus Methanomethylicaceae archaeon]